MGSISKIAKGVKTVVKVTGTVGEISTVIAPLAAMGEKILTDKIEESKHLIEIPRIISSDGYVKLEEAKRYIESAGLKAGEAIAKENAALKDCSAFDVVGRSDKQKKRVPPGTRIILYYVTQEVIEKSKRLFIEAEKQKAEEKRKKIEQMESKANEKIAQKEKNKQMIEGTFEDIKHGFVDAALIAQNRIKGIISNRKKLDDA
jgi:hypothetical protein